MNELSGENREITTNPEKNNSIKCRTKEWGDGRGILQIYLESDDPSFKRVLDIAESFSLADDLDSLDLI